MSDKQTSLPAGVETRSFKEFRVEKDGRTIEGHAATFGEPYQIADFEEQVAEGAFADAVAGDVRALLNHDPNHLLGRTTSGTLRLEEDDVGLHSEIDLPESRTDVLEAVERGDLSEMSFGFTVLEESWEEQDDGPDLRTIEKVELFDVSPVTFPANPNTDVAVRRHREFRSQVGDGGGTQETDDAHVETMTVRIDADVSPLRSKLSKAGFAFAPTIRRAMEVLSDWHTRARSVPRTAEELTFDGTTEDEWDSPAFSDFVDAFGWDAESVDDLSDEQRETVALHSLLGEFRTAATFDELVSFPVVEPNGPISRSALVNAKARARFAPNPDALQERVDQIIGDLFDEEEENSGDPVRLARARNRQAEAEII